MISFDLDRIVWEFINRSIGIGELWNQVAELPLDHSKHSEEADVFDAVILCEVHCADDVWSESQARDYLRKEMGRHPTVAGVWEGP